MNPNIIEHAEKLALKTLHLATVAESCQRRLLCMTAGKEWCRTSCKTRPALRYPNFDALLHCCDTGLQQTALG